MNEHFVYLDLGKNQCICIGDGCLMQVCLNMVYNQHWPETDSFVIVVPFNRPIEIGN